MKTVTLLATLLLFVMVAKAQTDNNPINNSRTSSVVSPDTIVIDEREPGFPGGSPELSKFLKKNVEYNGNDKGRVMVSFIIEKDGSLSDIRIIKSLSPSADEAVLKAMRKMPKWLPGIMNRHLLRVNYVLPVSF